MTEIKVKEVEVKEFKEKLINAFKRSHGILRIGFGDWNEITKAMELPSDAKEWKEISTGIMQGNFYGFNEGQGINAYAYLVDPLYGEGWEIYEVRGRRSHAELIRMVETRAELIHTRAFMGTKTCWECGKKFSFWQVKSSPELPAWEAFRQKIERWQDGYCGESE